MVEKLTTAAAGEGMDPDCWSSALNGVSLPDWGTTTGAGGLDVPLTGEADVVEVADDGPGWTGCCVATSALGATEGALLVAVTFVAGRGVGLVACQGEGKEMKLIIT